MSKSILCGGGSKYRVLAVTTAWTMGQLNKEILREFYGLVHPGMASETNLDRTVDYYHGRDEELVQQLEDRYGDVARDFFARRASQLKLRRLRKPLASQENGRLVPPKALRRDASTQTPRRRERWKPVAAFAALALAALFAMRPAKVDENSRALMRPAFDVGPPLRNCGDCGLRADGVFRCSPPTARRPPPEPRPRLALAPPPALTIRDRFLRQFRVLDMDIDE